MAREMTTAREMRERREARGRQSMPSTVRYAVLAGLAALLGGALYLIAVRGEALLADLSALSQRILLCF